MERNKIVKKIMAWWPLWRSLLSVLVCAGLFYLSPLQFFGANLYIALKLYRVWPVLLLLIGIGLLVGSNWQYRDQGLPMFFPAGIILVTIVFGIIIISLLMVTAVDWSVDWSIFALITLLVLAGVMTINLVRYGELWRKLANASVEEEVKKALKEDKFVENTQKQRWGTLHSLVIVQNEFIDMQKKEVSAKVQKK